MSNIKSRELLRQLRKLTVHPDQHDQGVWVKATTEGTPETAPRPSACGSFGCLAGNAVLASGKELYWERQGFGTNAEGKDIVRWIADYVQGPGDELGRSIADEAQALLGLDDDQARMLFSGSNTREDLWHLAIEYTHGELYPITLHDYVSALAEADEMAKAQQAEREAVAKEKAEKDEAEALLTKFRAAYPELYRAVDESRTKAEDRLKREQAEALARLRERLNQPYPGQRFVF